ncbi:unnamed protein product [Caenorhabditis brenneri]
MTSPTENTNLEMKLLDLQKKFGEEKRAHGETILQLLSAQAQAQTAEAEAVKAQKLVAETTLKLDQAREEIRGLRAHTQDAQYQAQEAHAKIKDLEAQMAQMRLSEQFQAQAQQLSAAQTKILLLNSEIRGLRAHVREQHENHVNTQLDQTRELEAAHAQVKNLESQMSQAQEEIESLRALVEFFGAQARELQEAQAKIKDLEAQIQTKAKFELNPPVQAPARMDFERFAISPQTPDQWFCIVQNGIRSYFEEPISENTHLFCKFIDDKSCVIIELVEPEHRFETLFRVSVSDGKRWMTIGFLGPENKKIHIGALGWRLIKRAPFVINADGIKEYLLTICCDALPSDSNTSSS